MTVWLIFLGIKTLIFHGFEVQRVVAKRFFNQAMLGCSLIRPFFSGEKGVFWCLLEYVDLLGKTPCWLFRKKPRWKFHSKNLSPPCMENTVRFTSYPPSYQLGIPKPTKSQGCLPSSWIIAIRQGRQDDELSKFFTMEWMGRFCIGAVFFLWSEWLSSIIIYLEPDHIFTEKTICSKLVVWSSRRIARLCSWPLRQSQRPTGSSEATSSSSHKNWGS